MNAITKEIQVGGKTIQLETGKLAKQADGSVVVRLGDTMVLCTTVTAPDPRAGQDFFPMSVEYRERFSAGGKFPGGFIKREARPSDKEIISARLVDRTLRPLFPDGFRNEVQIICTVLSADIEIDADVLAGIGASAATHISGAPFAGPTAHVRVARVGGELVLFPTFEQRASADFDLVVAGKEDALVMVEGELKEVGEDDVVDALAVAHDAIRAIIDGIRGLRADFEADRGATVAMTYTTVAAPTALVARIKEMVGEEVRAHLRKPYGKADFYGGLKEIRNRMIASVFGEGEMVLSVDPEGYTVDQYKAAYAKADSEIMREMILDEGIRLDGRKTDEIRPIWSEVGYLPRVHGSAIFTRGETQALAQVTLGTARNVQAIDQLFDQEDKRFYLQYNFPPFSTGEAKMLRGVSRREVGHGNLAERALKNQMPSTEEFPYTVRIISDVLESNGSSSMATVCSGSLALMDAGVPIHKPVAGIAMGLIYESEDRAAILSDILGTEDHLGDLDFKVCGTADGITAVQMDMKIEGLSQDTLRKALYQARDGRAHILGEMAKTMTEAREEIAPTAPRLIQLIIDTDFIGAIIGPGGKIIKGIQADTGAQIDIDERDGKGYVTVAAPDMDSAYAAIERIRGIVAQPEVGEVYTGTVKNLLGFGAIVEILPGKEAMLHVSEMAHGFVENPADVVQIGDKIEVQVIEIRDDGKVRLSRKPFLAEPTEEEKEAMRKAREERRAREGNGEGRREGRYEGERRGGPGGGSRGRGGPRR
jgi:polyribonucleotide nucleotidyltransferase